MSKLKPWNLGLALALITASGCGGGGAPPASSSNEEVTVKGTIKVNGSPLDGGEVIFDPSNINRKSALPRTAKVTAGAYELKTLVGENSVTIHSKVIDKDPILSANQKIIDVKSGDNTIPIDLP